MRKLISIPTVHADDESPLYALLSSDERDNTSYDSNEKARRYWKIVKEEVLGLDINFRDCRVFCESVKEDDAKRVEEVISKGSFLERGRKLYSRIEEHMVKKQMSTPNLALVVYLAIEGAKIGAAEDIHLLERQKNLWKELWGDAGGVVTQEVFHQMIKFTEDVFRISRERDEFTAKSINNQLQDGETGIAIWGADHNFIDYLDPEIEITELPRLTESLAELGINRRASLEQRRTTINDLAIEMGFKPVEGNNQASLESRG